MKQHDRALLTKAFRNILGRSAIRHREGNLLAEALRRISETLTFVKSPENSETPPALSESHAESADWAREAPSLSKRRVS
jgi:tRNA C32,U32 (ribose-2'-O)-methylase TrmJ